MKFLVLRTDLRKKLRFVKLLVVDFNIFSAELQNGHNGFASRIESESLQKLLDNNTGVVLCSDGANGAADSITKAIGIKHLALDGLSYSEILERLCQEFKLNKSQIAFVNATVSDKKLLSEINFSATTIDAPLRLKTASYYVSNFTGTQTLNEIMGIICAAKHS